MTDTIDLKSALGISSDILSVASAEYDKSGIIYCQQDYRRDGYCDVNTAHDQTGVNRFLICSGCLISSC